LDIFCFAGTLRLSRISFVPLDDRRTAMPAEFPTSQIRQSLHRIQTPSTSPRRTQDSTWTGLNIQWPSGLAPQPQPMSPAPGPDDPLPQVDVIAMMDTTAEAEAMSDVLTPGAYYASHWYQYAHNFDSTFLPQLGPNAPAMENKYLGLYFITQIGNLRVLVYKTNLHLHTDGLLLPDGSYTTPIKDMLAQMIQEAKPKLVLTTGTSGGVYCSMQLGDVALTRAAHFYCKQHYASAPFNGQTYTSQWTVPQQYASTAQALMQGFAGQLTGKGSPPDPACNCNPSGQYPTRIWFDGSGSIAPFHPVITTDFFEFGTSTNGLDQIGIAVEMDDAILGLVCSTMDSPPQWASVRNLSDPCINGALDTGLQGKCADYYYEEYGYWTTVMSGITTWSIIAGYWGGQ
jgi:nucleoside phosphorylase